MDYYGLHTWSISCVGQSNAFWRSQNETLHKIIVKIEKELTISWLALIWSSRLVDLLKERIQNLHLKICGVMKWAVKMFQFLNSSCNKMLRLQRVLILIYDSLFHGRVKNIYFYTQIWFGSCNELVVYVGKF